MISERARRRLDQATLVTGNPNKVAEAERICGFPMRHVAIDLPEIQSDDLAEVAREKALEAWRRLERPVIVEETGLELSALNGFPGPLVKWMLDAVGAEGIARTAAALDEPGARAVCLLVLYDGEETVSGEGRTEGRLVLPPRGDHGFGWDPVFQPEGESRSYAELGDARKDEIGHRGRAWRALAETLS
ncbi:MAG: non-canonical purine NTP pyrophosphatase [bacterium]|nr:non-canonical purine NTP pyrophosphatase [bacterium]